MNSVFPYGGPWAAANCIDGNTGAPYCHSGLVDTSDPWLSVQITPGYSISHVLIYNAATQPLMGYLSQGTYEVWLTNAPGRPSTSIGTKCNGRLRGPTTAGPFAVRCYGATAPNPAYVTVYYPADGGTRYLTLAEVEVYGDFHAPPSPP